MKISIGMKESERRKVADKLYEFLADTYVLYLKTQNFHWNMEGPGFISLHLLLQKHYEDMAEAIDEIAERIRSLGFFVDGSFSSFQKKSSLTEAKLPLSQKKMIEALRKDHEKLALRYRPAIGLSQKSHDEMSADLIIKRLQFHEKSAWLLRSHLG